MTKNVLLVALGALIMFVLLKIMAKNSGSTSKVNQRFIELTKTQQVSNLVKTNEFRELVKTKEFFNLIASLSNDYLTGVSIALTNTNKKI